MAVDATTAVLVEAPTGTNFTRAAGAFLAGFSSKETRNAYRRDLTRWGEFCAAHGLHPIDGIRRTHVELYMRALEGQALANNTRGRRLCSLKSFFGWYFDEELVPGNPAARVRPPREEHPVMPAMNRHEAHRFAQAAEDDPDPYCAGALHLLLLAGLRVSEACSCNATDLTIHQWVGVLNVRGKGDKLRQVELPARAMAALHGALAGRTTGPLLLNQAGRRITRENIRRQITRVSRRADVRTDLSPHCLRRSFIQIALDAGAPVRDVQLHVGHADSATTAKYDRRDLTIGRAPSNTVSAAIA